MRIALVQPPPRSEFDKHWARFAGLGIAYIAGSLRAAGHTIDMLDGKLAHLTVDDIVQSVRENRPDLVGITCMTVEYPRAIQIARRIKDMPRSERAAKWKELTGKSEPALYRRLAET